MIEADSYHQLVIPEAHRMPEQNRFMKSLKIVLSVIFCAMPNASEAANDQPVVVGIDPLDTEGAGQRDLVLHFPWQFRLPEIVRLRNLPHRMLNEPFLETPGVISELPTKFIETWTRCFQSETDLEIRIVATEHLSRLARLKNVDLTSIAADLTETLETTSSRRLMWGCLAVIRDGDLKQTADTMVKLAATSDDDVRRIVDPLLVKWKSQPAIEVWTSRIEDSSSSNTSRLLACRSLAQIGALQSTEAISKFVIDRSASFQLRSEAAAAVNALNEESARDLAAQLLKGSRLEKLLAIKLLNHADSSAIDSLLELCNDPNPAVAVAAWETVETHNPQRLLPLLEQGILHRESGIRACCTRLAALFPTPERIEAVFPLLGDNHIFVRNACRIAMTIIAEENEEFLEPIVDVVAQQLTNPQASWQIIEQACYVLAELRRPEFAESLIQLCRHERPEVFVAAAWLFHLMPEPKLKQEFGTVLDERLEIITSGAGANNPIFKELDQQISFLFQAAGYCKFTNEMPHMMEQVDKQSGLGEQGRGAGIWAIGALKEGTKDEAATKVLTGRLNDRMHPVMPEYNSVRRLAAQGMGRIQSESAFNALDFAFVKDGATSFIPQTARWSLSILGNPSPGAIPPSVKPLGAWKLQPLER